jgi:diadenosine tetraphosphate (Ap4A) HIT family hydrolase
VSLFCERIASGDLSLGANLAVSFPDASPVSPGYTLVIPRRDEADYFSLSDEENVAVWRLVDDVRRALDRDLRPDGNTIGLNAGAAAGQTVEHAHIHVIPRYSGDVPDPRGGIRWIFPDRARWWNEGG